MQPVTIQPPLATLLAQKVLMHMHPELILMAHWIKTLPLRAKPLTSQTGKKTELLHLKLLNSPSYLPPAYPEYIRK
jgi:hypothetical protein